jgi:hypothetical protein
VKPGLFGWILIFGLLVIGFVGVALSPRWQRPATAEERLKQNAKVALKQPPAPEPGEGKVTNNLSRAMRFQMPIVAMFTAHEHTHMSGPDRLALDAREKAEHAAHQKLAADYAGVLSVVEVNATNAPASAARAKVTHFPATIIYGEGKAPVVTSAPEPPPSRAELWRWQGEVSVQEIRGKLAALGIKPAKQAQGKQPRTAPPIRSGT